MPVINALDGYKAQLIADREISNEPTDEEVLDYYLTTAPEESAGQLVMPDVMFTMPNGKVRKGYFMHGWLKSNLDKYLIKAVKKKWDGLMCLSGDTIIQTKNGKIKLEDIKCNTVFVHAYDFKNKKHKYRKSKIFKTGKKQIYKVTLDDGNIIKATLEHKFFVINKDNQVVEKQLKDISVGDKLYTLKPLKSWSNLEIDFLKNKYSNHGVKWCANKLCRSKSSIIKKVSRLKLKINIKEAKKIWNIKRSQKVKDKLSKVKINNFLQIQNLNYLKEDLIKEYDINKKSLIYITQKYCIYSTQLLKRYLESWNIKIRNHKEAMSYFKGDNNVSKQKKVKQKISKGILKHFKKYPEKMPNRIMRFNNRKTKIEKIVEQILIKHNIKYKYNPTIHTNKSIRFPDFLIQNLIIECDGLYWHKKDKEKQIKRDRELIEKGYSILHFSDIKILKNEALVERCIIKQLQKLNLME